MTIDFSKLLTPEHRACLRRTGVEIARLYGLGDRWLAEALLRLARDVRAAFPQKLGDPYGIVYDPNFVWHIVPEVARRLGATRLLPNEAKDPRIVTLDGSDLRQCAGVYLQHLSIDRWVRLPPEQRPSAAELLCHSIPNGNPVAFALDRLYEAPAADADRDDWIAHHVREIAARRGFGNTPYWSPAMQDKPPLPDRPRTKAYNGIDRRQLPSIRPGPGSS